MVDSCESSAQPGPRTCALCTTPARYRCPRCTTPTCSLPCARKHKQDTGCTGERDKVQHVPMNAYGWGTMMRDYCYLEDVGRKVSEWGREIARGRYTMENNGASKAAHGRREGRPSSGRKPTTANSKRHILRAHLETLGIDVELLPARMERRNLSQSTFDQKSKCPLLTMELVFYPPTTLASVSSPLPPSYNILSHRNDLSATLLTILQRQVSLTFSKSQKRKQNTPDWLPSIVNPHPEAPECFIPPHCYIRAHGEFPHAPNATYYHKLEPTLSLCELLRRTSFIEFPTIHVFDPEASSFCGTVIDKSGSIARPSEDDQGNVARVKRRRLSKMVGLKAIVSLVGDYGSEGGSQSDEETPNKHPTGLATLEAYSGSDDEGATANVEMEDQSLNSDDDLTPEGSLLDPARLVEVLKQARSAADEDLVDWGDEWDVDADECVQ